MAPQMNTEHSPTTYHRSPQRSPQRRMMKSRLSIDLASPRKVSNKQNSPNQHPLLNEVRESLTMPSYSKSTDDDNGDNDSEVLDYDDGYNRHQRQPKAYLTNVDAIISKSCRHNANTTIQRVEQAPPSTTARKYIIKAESDDQSISAATTKSTKSTRSIRTMFRRKTMGVGHISNKTGVDSDTKSVHTISNVSVAASTKSSWWKRSSATTPSTTPSTPATVAGSQPKTNDNQQQQPNKSRGDTQTTFRSFQVKKSDLKSSSSSFRSRSSVKNKNDQLVMDFFDVKSFVSEPDLPRHKVDTVQQQHHGRKKQLETSSVVSNRSQRSNIFSKFFLRMRAINDEVLDIDDSIAPDLVGTGLVFSDDNSSLVDDELTICSGFSKLSRMGSLQGDDDDDEDNDDSSRGSLESQYSMLSNVSDKISTSNQRQYPIVQETPFIHKIMQRRILKNESTKLREVVGFNNSHTNIMNSANNFNSSSTGIESPTNRKMTMQIVGIDNTSIKRIESPVNRIGKKSIQGNIESPTQRSKALAQAGMKLMSSKSMSHLPSSIEPVVETPPRAVRPGLCRWNSDLSLRSDPSAPKRPSRGGGSNRNNNASEGSPNNNVASTPSPSARLSPKKGIDKQITTSQSMRNLCSTNESKNGSEEDDDDDDSILSLLSGLLATWSAERDGINVSIAQDIPSTFNGRGRLKSILKSSSSSSSTSFDYEHNEQKVESRERYSVRFKTIEIREYERIVGDNPSCSKGPPISIGWEYILCPMYTINEYERLVRGPKRTKKEFHLPADRRTELLIHEWECSEDDIRKARREATYIQYCRAKTAFSGSRAAAKEAAFLRKANDRSKLLPSAGAMNQAINNQNETQLPKAPCRRPTIDVTASLSTNTSNPRPGKPMMPINTALSASVRHKPFLEV